MNTKPLALSRLEPYKPVMLKVLLLLFIAVPLLELYLLIEVGAGLGGFFTIALCVLTAAIGGILIRLQGVQTLFSAQQQLAQGQPPEQEMLHGFLLAIAGVCLFLPGFLTDAIGFLLLIPTLRKIMIHRVHIQDKTQSTIIDVEVIDQKIHLKD